MNSNITLPRPTPANLETAFELESSLSKKATAEPGEGLYPRDGVEDAACAEALISEVTWPDKDNVVVFASGMAAVRETVIFGAVRNEGQASIAHARELYSQSTKHFVNLRSIGAKITNFDSGDEESTERKLDCETDVLFAETVGNTPGSPILNVHRLLTRLRSLDNPPLVVLDNTLPLSTGFDFTELLMSDDPVIVVESGTKNAMNNSELLGVAYSPNQDLIDDLRRHKAHSGAVNSTGGLPRIINTLLATLPDYHKRNRNVFRSTGKIALALAEAQKELGEETDFYTIFNTNPDHPNYEYFKKISKDNAYGISPVTFISSAVLSDDAAPKLLRKITEHPNVKEQIKEGELHLGQSFGFPKARLLYDGDSPNIRFAGGYDQADEEALAEAVKVALLDR